MWLINSSIGRKLVMAITGAVLVLFVTFHCLMNAVALFWPAAYNSVCEFLGANWYALAGSAVIALLIIVHIVYAVWLTLQNRDARGNDRYNVVKKPAQVEWASQNMLVLGIVVLAFFVIHLIQFWSKMQLAEIMGTPVTDCTNGAEVPPAAGTWFLQIAFSQWYTLPVYIIGFVALWFHMTHGVWSMFQSCGWNGQIWLQRTKCIANWWTTIVIALFLAEAVVFTVQANRGGSTSCPALLEQYAEMASEGKNAGVPGIECASACQQTVCNEACTNNCTDCQQKCEACAKNCESCANCEGCAESCANCEGCANGCEQCQSCADNCGKCAKQCPNEETVIIENN